MRKLKKSVQQAATLSLLLSLVFYSFAPAFSMPVFALEQVSNEKPAQQTSTSNTDLSQIDLLEKPLEVVLEPDIRPIDVGQINPVEILPEEIAPKEDLLPPEDANRDGEEPEPYIQKDEIKSLTDKLNINTDTNTGAFNYNYPIEVPAGRNNLQPDLALSYNNQDTNNQNLFGYGWSLNIPSIERLNKTGIDNLYTDNYFTSSLGGELADISLSDDIHGTYGPRVENGDFLKYEYTVNNTWLVTDKMGTVYTFGKLDLDRQDDPNDNTKIYKWMLSEIRDTNDNFIRYQYYKDAGQIYPEKIFYTGHGEIDGIFEVEFIREERTDNLTSFQTGFSVTNNYRFSQILVKINNQWQKKYYLNYETGDNGNRSLLSGIQQAAPSPEQEVEATMPEEEFEYPTNFTEAWTEIENFDLPDFLKYGDSTNGDYGVRFGDVNGDGLSDMVHSHIRMTSHAGDIITKNVYINQGDNTWEIDANYDIPVYFARLNNVGPYIFDAVYVEDGARLVDVNGDALADIIEARIENDDSETKHVYINKGDGTGWEEDLNYVIPFAFIERFTANGSFLDFDVRLVDVNGDALVDALASYRHYTWYYTDNFVDTKHVYINKGDGTGWEEDLNYVIPVPFMYKNLPVSGAGANGTIDTGVRLSDVNSDALVDIIESRYERIGYYYPSPGWTRYINNVYLNKGDGTGWEETDHYVVPDIFVQVMESGRYFSNEDSFVRLMDINGDHLDDVVKSRYIDYNNEVNIDQGVWINKGDGTGWHSDSDEDLPFYFSIFDPHHEGSAIGEFDNGCQFSDVNGDTVVDVLCSRPPRQNPMDVHNIYINNNHNKVLESINNNQGTEITLDYQSSVQYTEANSEVAMSSQRDAEVLMPEEEFGYQINESLGWSEDVEWQLPISFSGDGNEHQFGVVIADANGDSLPDIVQRGKIYNSLTERNNFSLNSGNDWGAGSHYVGVPVIINFREPYNHRVEDRGVRFLDVNGDNLVDVLQSFGVLRDVYINNGTSWNLDSSWTIPISFVGYGVNAGVGIEIVDVNGDGFIDIVKSNQNCQGQITNNVYINNGQAWILDPSWVVPEFISYCNGNINQVIFDMGVRFVDVNNDGLVDILRGYNQSRTVYINNGHSWNPDESWVLPEGFAYGREGNVLNVMTMDVNGDFLPDIVRSNNSEHNPNYSSANKIYLNNGHNWILQEDLQFPFTAHDASDEGIRISDVNGDNLVDVIKGFSNDRRVFINNADTIFLNNINKDSGVNLFIDYQSSAQSWDIGDALANQKLPYVIQTVKQINVFDGVATTTIDYKYSGGEQYFDAEYSRDKKFAGFAKVEKTIGDKTSKTYYHQGNETNTDLGESLDTYAKIGKVYRQEIYDIENSQSTNIYKWQEQDLNSNRQFVFQDQESNSLLYGDRSFEDYLESRMNDVHTVSLWHMDGEVGTSEKKYNENRNPNLDLVEGNNPTAVLGFDGISENGAYQFNGTNQYLSFIPYNAGTSDFTIDGWVKLSSINVSQPIFHQEQHGYTGRPNLNVWVNSENHVNCQAAELGDDGLEDQYVVSNSALSIDTWTHIACSRENGLYSLYINGELDSSNSYEHNNFVYGISSTAYFGRRYNSFYPNSQVYFHGAIDEWRISNTANIAVEPDDFDQLYADYLESLDNFDSIATQYTYDPTNGNILSENNLGQVELNTNTGEILDTLVGDEKTTTYEYAQNEVKHILSAPKEKVITDSIDTKSQELYYDDLAFGQVNKVNLTKEDYVVDNVEVNRDFNELGLVVAETDPENNTSNIVYDEYNLYPNTTTNALGQSSLTEYNLLNGQVERSVAANGAITENQFDAFGRLVKTQVSSPSSTAELLTKQEIVYQDFEFPRYKETKDYFDINQYKIQREYYDGLDRVIQTKAQMAESESWSTQDTTYDAQGRVVSQSLPYITDSVDCSLSVCVAQEPLPLIPNEFTVETDTLSLWHMNGVANSIDKKDNAEGSEALDLIENNIPLSVSGFDNLLDGAYSLDSDASQYLSVTDQASVDLTGAFTIEAWVKFDSLPTNEIRAFISKNNSANNNQAYLFGYREDGGPAGLHVRLSSGGTDATTVSGLWPWVPSLNTWYYVAMVYDPSQEMASNRVMTYINGVSQGTVATSWPSSIYNSMSSFRLGASENGQHFDGVIDEVNILHRCKTSTEIGEYYNSFASVRDIDLQQPAKTYTYDALDRVLTESTPVGTTSYVYDGFTTTIYDANNHRKDLVKDAHGNLVQVREYNGQDIYTTNYEYNLTNKLTKITDAQGNVRNFIYDELDNLVEQDEIHRSDVHNIQNLTYTYDKNGNVLSKNNFNGQVIDYTYDDLNRVLTESLNGSLKIRYTYDQGLYNVGQLTKVEYLDNGNWQEYDYDILGRQSAYRAKIGRENYSLNQVNLLSGDVSYIIYPDDKTLVYVKNSIGQNDFLNISGENQIFAENLRYNVNGQLIHLERGNGVVTDYTYDPAQAYRLTNILTSNNEAILQNISYTYDAVGNILQIEDIAINGLAKIATYQYDDLNRLLSTQVQYLQQPENNHTQTFSYDAIGNILSNSALGEYQYLAANPQQLSALGTRNFVYDNAGNLLNDSQKTLTWDWRNRLSKSQNFGSDDFTSYEYDHQNQRLAKITKIERTDVEPEIIIIGAAAVSSPKIPPIDISNEITLNEEHYIDQYFEKNVKTGDYKAHIFLNGQKIATINNDDDPYYVISDHLNSSSILVDNAGTIAEVSDYKPFGSQAYQNTITDLDNDYAFTGKELDEESSLQYFGARYMDNEVGRFVSVDPAVLTFGNAKEFKDKYDRSLEFHLSNPQNLNSYSYVTNNPLRYTDPDGEIIPLLVIGGMVVAGILFDNVQAAQAPTTTNAPSQSIATESKDFAELVSPKYDSLGSIQKFGLGLMTFGITNKVSNYGVKVSNKIAVDLADSTIEKKFIKHVEKQGEFGGNITKEEFKNTLENIWKGSGNLLQKIRDNGDVLRYDVEKNIFSSIKNNGALKTIFQPKEGVDYWLKQ